MSAQNKASAEAGTSRQIEDDTNTNVQPTQIIPESHHIREPYSDDSGLIDDIIKILNTGSIRCVILIKNNLK